MTDNFVVHHNIIWNVFDSMGLKGNNNKLYNNTFAGSENGLQIW